MTGITFASPLSCRSSAFFISTLQQYFEAMKLALTSSRMMSAEAQLAVDLLRPLLADVDVRSCHSAIIPLQRSGQMIFKLLPQLLVAVRVGVEQADRLFLMCSVRH